MKVIGGPIDGADIPRHSAHKYMMVTFYYDFAPEDAQNFVYEQMKIKNAWAFSPLATNAARAALRTSDGGGR